MNTGLNIGLWIVQVSLLGIYGAYGVYKTFFTEKAKQKMAWTHGRSDNFIRFVGVAELLGAVGVNWQQVVEGRPPEPLFDVRIVSESGDALASERRWSVQPHGTLADVPRTDVIFIPSLWIAPGETFAGRHGALKDWIARQYRQGAMVCAACTGVLLLADTGLLDGESATTHWAYEAAMRRQYPLIRLQADKVMIESGADLHKLDTHGGYMEIDTLEDASMADAWWRGAP